MKIRELAKEECGAVLELAWEVFQAFEAPDYTSQGAETFYASIHDADYLARLRIYGTFEGDTFWLPAAVARISHYSLCAVRTIGRALADSFFSAPAGTIPPGR
ncbi:hypothetical protein [Oscillibacter ruminantium]|uniref:hypothetical protein n=1 Tax=Oscillibacter ruminantium TaxID=1263547 RepID=UPI003317CA5D